MYNQKYHQFDNFYNHKFAFHITGPRQDAFEAVLRLKPKVVKTLDFSVDVMKRIRREIPDVFLIGRLFVHPQDFGQLSGGTARAARQQGRRMAERILREEVNQSRHHINGRPIFHAWESLNEVFPEWTDEETQQLFDEYQVAFGQKMRTAGFEPVAFNFGQGNGRGQQWLKLYPGTLEFYKYLGFHEYDWPTMDRLHRLGLSGPVEPQHWVPGVGQGRGNDGMWRCLRYRRIMNEGIRQRYGDQHTVIITECGMTQGVWGGAAKDIGPWARELTVPRDIPGGVASTPIPVDDYWRTLQWYNSQLMQDDYVMAACLFVTGATGRPEWQTFEHLGPIMERIAAFQKRLDLTAPPRRPESLVVEGTLPEFGAGDENEDEDEAGDDEAKEREADGTHPPPLVPNVAPPPFTAPVSPESPAAAPGWDYELEVGQGLGLLVGDIGLANEPITITKPNGAVERLRSGSKPEFGVGGFETYANIPGTYRLEFLDQQFDIPLTGRFTRISFSPATPAPDEPIRVSLSLRRGRQSYAVGERVFITLAVTNHQQAPLTFGLADLVVDNGYAQTVWDRGRIPPGETLRHEDGLAFDRPGRYRINLSLCLSEPAACLETVERWQNFEPSVEVTVR